MILERKMGFYALFGVVQLAAVAVSFVSWYGLADYVYEKEFTRPLSGYLVYTAVIIAALTIHLFVAKEEGSDALTSGALSRWRFSLVQWAVAVSALSVFLVATKDTAISRAFLFSYLPVLLLVLSLTTIFLPLPMLRGLFRRNALEKVLLVCWDESADGRSFRRPKLEKIRRWLHAKFKFGVRAVGVLCGDRGMADVLQVPCMGHPENLAEALAQNQVTAVVLAELPANKETLGLVIEACEKAAVRLSILQDYDEHLGRPVHVVHTDGVTLLQLRREPLQSPLLRIGKRMMDIFMALPVVVFILPPLALLVFIFQRKQAPGALLCRQVRSGRNNEPFQIYKFRTMYDVEFDVSVQASSGDERVYPFGSLLRRTSLDEFPQFVNVLKGDMSVVGPRPHLPSHNDQWQDLLKPYHVRSLVRPGLTGLAQIRGHRGEVREEHDIKQRVICDIEYIERCSLLFDVGIIAKTALQVLFPRSTAY